MKTIPSWVVSAVCFLPVASFVTASFTGCASTRKKDEADAAEKTSLQAQLSEIRVHLNSVQGRMDGLETKVSTINDKTDATRASVDGIILQQRPKATPVVSHPSSAAGSDVDNSETITAAASDPEAGFVNDAAVSAYRQGKILFQSRKYPEAVLAFSSFLEKYADHTLAGSAQYYVGESYLKQKEYQLAVQEFQRVLTSYDRSSVVPDTLKEMANAEEMLKKLDDAAGHRQLLMSLYPQSPAALESSTQEIRQAVKGSQKSPQKDAQNKTQPAADQPVAPPSNLDEIPPTAPNLPSGSQN